jgi:hypothetical protein
MSSIELAFHIAELLVLVFGVAWPATWAALRFRSILQDFPPHRHLGERTILYPKGYAPGPLSGSRDRI